MTDNSEVKLFHYAMKPLTGTLYNCQQTPQKRPHVSAFEKPRGLWVSACEDKDSEGETWGWFDWCKSEKFRILALIERHKVTVHACHLLWLRSTEDMKTFQSNYGVEYTYYGRPRVYIDWEAVAKDHKGIVITPYQWEMRLDMDWYYGWDCASGCIWDVSAIKDVVRAADGPPMIDRLDAVFRREA